MLLICRTLGLSWAGGLAPLIGHLSNRQFWSKLDDLLTDGTTNVPVRMNVSFCHCGCGSEVASGRKFVNQVHYDRSRSLPSTDAEQLVARFRRGVRKRQLAEEYGLSLCAVKRLLKKHLG